MRYLASEKAEIIRLVEQSHLPARRTLEKLGIPRATFYRWYDRYLNGGPEALQDRPARPGRIWNRIPEKVRNQIIALALGQPELSPRELACASLTREVFRLGGLGLPPAQGARPDHQPSLHRDQGGERVPGQDHRAEPALADRLHLPEGHWLGWTTSRAPSSPGSSAPRCRPPTSPRRLTWR